MRTARRLVWPSDWLARALANAVPTGPVLLPIKQIDVRDLVPFADKGFTDVHDDVAGHGLVLLGCCSRKWVNQPIQTRRSLSGSTIRTSRTRLASRTL